MNIKELSKMNYSSWSQAAEEAFSIKPKDVNTNTWRAQFYRDLLTRDYLGSVEIKCPEYWYKDYIRYNLLINGQIAVVRKDGVAIPTTYTVKERNLWKYPKTIGSSSEISFPDSTVGVDCELVYLHSQSPFLTENLMPMDIIDIFATKLADCDASIDINLFNTKTPWLIEADNKTEAETFRNIFTRISQGQPAVFWKSRNKGMSNSVNRNVTTLPVKANYIADVVQDEKQAIYNEFLTIIGVNNSNVEKKERLLVDEVNANNELIDVSVDLWQQNLDECCEKVRNMFGIEFEISFYPKRMEKEQEKQERSVQDETNGFSGNNGDKNE